MVDLQMEGLGERDKETDLVLVMEVLDVSERSTERVRVKERLRCGTRSVGICEVPRVRHTGGFGWLRFRRHQLSTWDTKGW